MNIFVLFLVCTFYLIYLWLNKRRNFWKNLGFPYAELVFPFGSLKGVGSTLSIGERHDELYKEYKSKGPAVGIFYFMSPTLLVIDPDLVKCVLIQSFDNFHDRSLYYNEEDDPISAHLVALEGKEWYDRRAKLTPAFTSAKLKTMFEILITTGDKFVRVLDSVTSVKSEIEMRDWLARFTIDIISSVAFGLDSSCLEDENSEFSKYGKQIMDNNPAECLKFFFTCAFPKASKKMHLTANKKSVIDYFYNLFKENIEYRESSNTTRKDFMQILLELKKTTSLTISNLSAEAFIFFLAGFETSSTLMNFILYELSLNRDVQEKLRKEINATLTDCNGELTYDKLVKLTYLKMIIDETLRKYPPIYMLMRRSKKEFKVPGTEMIIPANMDIKINTISIHMDPEYYPDPQKFIPERFTQENIQNRHPLTYLPFGDGPRKCIGARFGLMQTKIGIIKLVSNYDFSIASQTSIPMKFTPTGLFLAPANEMWLNVKKIIK